MRADALQHFRQSTGEEHRRVEFLFGQLGKKSLEPSDDRWPMILRIFAVKAPEPPLDITSEVIRIWCKESHYDYAAALARASIANTEEKADALEFTFAVFRGEDWPNTVVRVSWLGISEIMREVKEHGVVRKDHRYGTKYVEKMPLRESKKQP